MRKRLDSKCLAPLSLVSLLVWTSAILMSACSGENKEIPGAVASHDAVAPSQNQENTAPSRTVSSSDILVEKEISIPTGDHESIRAKVWRNDPTEDAAHPKTMLFVSGVDGGLEEPVDGIYTRMAKSFASRGVLSVFIDYRQPGELGPSVQDAIAGANWLKSQGAKSIVLGGWSFGGAVVFNTAPRVPEVRSIIGFALQSLDTDSAADLLPHQSVLMFHSEQDENVPFWAAGQILEILPPSVRREFHPFPDGNHHLEGKMDQIDPVVHHWIAKELQLE